MEGKNTNELKLERISRKSRNGKMKKKIKNNAGNICISSYLGTR